MHKNICGGRSAPSKGYGLFEWGIRYDPDRVGKLQEVMKTSDSDLSTFNAKKLELYLINAKSTEAAKLRL